MHKKGHFFKFQVQMEGGKKNILECKSMPTLMQN